MGDALRAGCSPRWRRKGRNFKTPLFWDMACPGKWVEEVAMSDPASERQDADAYEHRVAAEIVAMLRNTGVDARRVLAYAHAILNLGSPGEAASPAAHDVTRCGPRTTFGARSGA
jgi:hypothetical protein